VEDEEVEVETVTEEIEEEVQKTAILQKVLEELEIVVKNHFLKKRVLIKAEIQEDLEEDRNKKHTTNKKPLLITVVFFDFVSFEFIVTYKLTQFENNQT
jgi:hypothetical protein